MKLLRSLKLFSGLLLLAILMAGCNDDEMSITGKVEVAFTNHPSDLVVFISPAENYEIVISPPLKTDSDGKLSYRLNYGNYILRSQSSTFFNDVGFQIRAGHTTFIYYHSNNVGEVQ